MAKERSDQELKSLLVDSRKVLRLGQLRDSEEWMSHRLLDHGLDADELRAAIYSDIASLDNQEAFYDHSVEKLKAMAHGDEQLAETFMVLDSLDCMADRIFENLHYQAMMKRNGTLNGEYAEKMDADLKTLRSHLSHCISQFSDSSPMIVDTVLDSFIGGLKDALGLTTQRVR